MHAHTHAWAYIEFLNHADRPGLPLYSKAKIMLERERDRERARRGDSAHARACVCVGGGGWGVPSRIVSLLTQILHVMHMFRAYAELPVIKVTT
jgi:hypothetical protein